MISRVALLLLLLLAAPARADSSGPVVFGRSEVTIATQAGGSFRFAIEVAETPDQLHQGLMFRDSMADDAGMLFLLEKEDVASFWMRNTFLPLDMLFIARDGHITNIHRNAAPGSTATHHACRPSSSHVPSTSRPPGSTRADIWRQAASTSSRRMNRV